MKVSNIMIGLVLIAFILGIGCFSVILMKDSKGPEIIFPDQDIEYAAGDDISVLVENVSAYDKKDGDVSDTLVIQNIYEDAEKNQVIVTYIAQDREHNVTKVKRTISRSGKGTITNSPAPTIQPSPTVQPSPTTPPSTTEPTDQPDEVEPTMIPDVVQGKEPIMLLNTDTVTLKKGSRLDLNEFIGVLMDDEDDETYLWRHVIISGTYDTKKAGTYEFKLYALDSDGNRSNIEPVTLIVEE